MTAVIVTVLVKVNSEDRNYSDDSSELTVKSHCEDSTRKCRMVVVLMR